MSSTFSFDIVSEVNLQEVKNALQQVTKELAQRYDLKDSHSSVDLDEKELTLSLVSADDYKLKAVDEILRQRLLKRNVSVKSLEYKPIEQTPSGQVKQDIKIQQGIPQEKAKEIVKLIKNKGIKVQSQIQDEQIRVTGKSKDDLQSVINFI